MRLARPPLSGAFKLAVSTGMIVSNPMVRAPRPKAKRSIPRHLTPEQAREFLALMEGDRTWPLWAFLLGSGLRIGEAVPLRWEAWTSAGDTPEWSTSCRRCRPTEGNPPESNSLPRR